ncbi:MAG: phenylalanine--tRNA ligase subunit beta, partial [Actinobacteria bacterium]|nr:phenylalanine--tRNA ligase subunit beta [Actinomycetota bacterium]
MRIVRSWLEEFVDVRKVSDEQLADAITSLGLSVEATEVVGTAIAGVVVAKVLRTDRHPEANKARL